MSNAQQFQHLSQLQRRCKEAEQDMSLIQRMSQNASNMPSHPSPNAFASPLDDQDKDHLATDIKDAACQAFPATLGTVTHDITPDHEQDLIK